MLADWFCTIDGKRIGPFNSQQLKAAAAKGQIRPDHLVRRGDDGPWLPAGRIKGLFPEALKASGGSNQPLKAICFALGGTDRKSRFAIKQPHRRCFFRGIKRNPMKIVRAIVADDSTFNVDQLNINEPPH